MEEDGAWALPPSTLSEAASAALTSVVNSFSDKAICSEPSPPTGSPSLVSTAAKAPFTFQVGAFAKKKHEEKHRKKDPRSWENITKMLANMGEDKRCVYMEDRYKDLYYENRDLTATNQQLSKQCTAIQKELDNKEADLAKSVIARARLESLCRELQKQNKQIKEENIAKIKEEEERRKEVSLRFADKLSDINNMMDENKEKSDKLRDENLKMTSKLAELYDQFQQREEDISKMARQLEMERELSATNLAKMKLEIQVEKENNAREQILLKNNLAQSEANCAMLLTTVKELQENIDVYKHQYEDFETTMSKSTKVFDSFKFEIANMTKQLKTLEQEADSWKEKYKNTMKALIEVTEAKKNQDIYISGVEKKIEQLQKLCRQLQVDRGSFLKLLKTHGIEPTSTACLDETEKKAESLQMTKKEKELQILKDNLKAVQEELTRLSVEEAHKNEVNKTDEELRQVEIEVDDAKDVQSSEEKVLTCTNSDVSSQEVVIVDSDRPDNASAAKESN